MFRSSARTVVQLAHDLVQRRNCRPLLKNTLRTPRPTWCSDQLRQVWMYPKQYLVQFAQWTKMRNLFLHQKISHQRTHPKKPCSRIEHRPKPAIRASCPSQLLGLMSTRVSLRKATLTSRHLLCSLLKNPSLMTPSMTNPSLQPKNPASPHHPPKSSCQLLGPSTRRKPRVRPRFSNQSADQSVVSRHPRRVFKVP